MSEREIARAAYSYQGGIEAWYLTRFLRSRNLNARVEMRNGFAPNIALPAIAGVRLGSAGHFIALLEKTDHEFVVGDPLLGELRLDQDALQNRYQFTGFYLPISKKE